jgi:uncharacterized repeat protein (TIGR04076 family)
MHELWVAVERVMGTCTAQIPMTPGQGFLVRNGRLSFPGGGPICLFALQSVIPLLPAKERSLAEHDTDDWMRRVDDAQCPDPKGRTIWRIEPRPAGTTRVPLARGPQPRSGDLRIVVDRVDGTCTAGMCPGHLALLRGSGLYLPQGFCLYALQAVLPLLPAMQRPLAPDDWMATERCVICPDPRGNVVMRIEKIEDSP